MYNNIPKIALSFDIEDWFTVRNMREIYRESDWDKLEMRVRIGLDFILESLEAKNIKATFFVLGWLAERYPHIIKEISDMGHEVASHGHSHTPIDLLTPETFREDLAKSIDVISSVTGLPVRGFRAPSFSVTKKTAWAIDTMKECGILYDSSIFSTLHPDYGINNFPNKIVNVDGVIEVPLRKGNFYGMGVPACGGGYFRMLPYSLIKSTLSQTLEEGPLVMYFHPWEFDPNQPRVNMSVLKKFRHYIGLNENMDKFQKLLNDFEFSTIYDMIAEERRLHTLDFMSLKPASVKGFNPMPVAQ